MSSGIYLIKEDDHLVEMTEKSYDSDALLQELLEKYPNLLAVNPNAKQWLIIKRSNAISLDEADGDQWLLNHLFLDQQGIPTLVSVKRENDSQNDLQLLGQMIDYAAHLIVYWSIETILSSFESFCHHQNKDPEKVLDTFLQEKLTEDQFWQQVKTNLQAGKIRLIFVGDQIPPSLQRVIEFLNKQMDPAEVLGLELKQYISPENDLKTLVAKVIGQTVEAQQKKSSIPRERRQWNYDSFLLEYQQRYGEEETNLVKQIYQWAINYAPILTVDWSIGSLYGGFRVKWLNCDQEFHDLFFLGIDGNLQISSEEYGLLPIFNSEVSWEELRTKLSSIGLALPTDRQEKRFPNFPLANLSENQTALNQVLTTFDWLLSKIQNHC